MAIKYVVSFNAGDGDLPMKSGAPRDSLNRLASKLKKIASGANSSAWTVDTRNTAVAATGTVTLTACAAGTVIEINGVDFTAFSGTVTAGNNEFDMSGNDTADATALAAAVNASTTAGIANVVTATSSSNVVTLTSTQAGLLGNALTIKTGGVRANGTVTYSGSSGAQTVLINGVTVYNATGATDAANATAAAAAINASTDPLVQGHAKALARAGVCYIYAAYDSIRGNAITLSATGTGATASVARLAGATAASCDGAQATGTLTVAGASGTFTPTINGVSTAAVNFNSTTTQTASDIADAINKLTSALVADCISATASGAVVTITASRGGISGNAITLAGAASVGTLTASGARLTGGAVPTTATFSAARLTAGSEDTKFSYSF